MRSNEKAIIAVIISTGISSVATQLYTIREFLTQFQGNEFVIALTLFNWLFLGGLGTFLASAISPKLLKATRKNLVVITLLLALMPSLQVLAVRMMRDVFFIHGSSVGFYQTLAYTFFLTAPYCILVGFALPYSLFVVRSEQDDYPGAYVYMADNLGDVAGGALFSFLLISLLTPLKALLLANIPLVVAGVCLFSKFKHRVITGTVGILVIFTLIISAGYELNSLVRPEGKLVHYQETRYGRIEIHQDREQFTFFSDGSPMYSSQNEATAQEAVHFPLSQLKNQSAILLISAEGGMLTEVAKYNPKEVDYLELDPETTRVGFLYGMFEKIPGLNLIHQDGRAWLSRTDKLYDAIIVSLPEPQTYQVNRFYTDKFIEMVRNHLAPGGIYSFKVQGYDNYLDEPKRQKISSLYNTVSRHFDHVKILPGQEIYFLCSTKPIEMDIPRLLSQKGIRADYVTYYYDGNITPERIQYINELLDPSTPTNHDFNPQLMQIMFKQWFVKFDSSPLLFSGCLGLFLIVYLLRVKLEEFVLFSTGFMIMGSEILVIFVFQIFYGYIYSQIGIIVTVFLFGLLPGAWLGKKLSRHEKKHGKKVLSILDGLLIGILVIFLLVLIFSKTITPTWLLLFFGFLVSFACGCQFPVAFELCGGDNKAATHTFSADLIGAACGTLIISIVLIPYVGIIWSTIALISLKTISLAFVAVSKRL